MAAFSTSASLRTLSSSVKLYRKKPFTRPKITVLPQSNPLLSQNLRLSAATTPRSFICKSQSNNRSDASTPRPDQSAPDHFPHQAVLHLLLEGDTGPAGGVAGHAGSSVAGGGADAGCKGV
ncbi:hypothetical protein RHSIM_Rhsim08G0079600 [Rhododendron simsii]|uniref:Uncharacterized protein n=1 Tax=Rhododendron simsii TaxID=118357 RepID=A0A834GLA0_RHOSS|nr:hypothetical protein RHSIM_Rhsim08G0079600 [Rhododendron simsii]